MKEWFKSLKPSDWLQLISIIASIAAIFISNMLGRWDALRQSKRQQKLNRYNNLYIPFIKFIFHEDPIPLLLANIVGNNEFDELDNLIKGNLKYLGKSSADKYYKLVNTGVPAIRNNFDKILKMAQKGEFQAGKSINMDKEAYQACLLFNDFVLEVLQESVDLAKELKLEPVGQTLLDVYSKKIRRPE